MSFANIRMKYTPLKSSFVNNINTKFIKIVCKLLGVAEMNGEKMLDSAHSLALGPWQGDII